MTDDVLLTVEGVSKRYATRLRSALTYGMTDGLRALAGIAPPAELRGGEFWALRDINFTLRRGHALAVLGTNGAGKSTLLKIIYGILKPDTGSVRRTPNCYGLMELGIGLDPRLSGWENIRLWAAQQDRSRVDRARMEDVAADFSGLDAHLDKPVQSYSNGMKARLSFALAVASGADLLLIDEALAVGDTGFSRKCFDHLHRHVEQGGALLVTSHQMPLVARLCQSALVIDHGVQSSVGPIDRAGLADMEASDAAPAGHADWLMPAEQGVTITAIRAESADGGPLVSRGGVRLVMDVESTVTTTARPGFMLWSYDRSQCVYAVSNPAAQAITPGRHRFVAHVDAMALVPGRYWIGGVMSSPPSLIFIAELGIVSRGAALMTLDGAPGQDLVSIAATGQVAAFVATWDCESADVASAKGAGDAA